jgi:hypothetical protein
MPPEDSKGPEWRPYTFARDQWHCRICGGRFQYSETVPKHIAEAHDENMPPSMYDYFRGRSLAAKENPMILPRPSPPRRHGWCICCARFGPVG